MAKSEQQSIDEQLIKQAEADEKAAEQDEAKEDAPKENKRAPTGATEASATSSSDAPKQEKKSAPKDDGSTKEVITADAKPVKRLMAEDDSIFQNILDTSKFEHLWRVANAFSRASLVPTHFQNKPENCFVILQMAVRLNIDPFMLMQNTYVVHNRPGMEAKLAIALINSSGLFEQPLQFTMTGKLEDKTLSCYAWTTRRGGEVVEGPPVTWEMVEAEGWHKDKGSVKSKWTTLPDLMMRYRSATFFARVVCPERLMGMQTIDELDDHVDLVEEVEQRKPIEQPKEITDGNDEPVS